MSDIEKKQEMLPNIVHEPNQQSELQANASGVSNMVLMSDIQKMGAEDMASLLSAFISEE